MRAPEDVLVWRDVLHDGPVPAGLDADELAADARAPLTARSRSTTPRPRRWRCSASATPGSPPTRRRRGGAVVRGRPVRRAPLAQIEDRLAGRPGRSTRVALPHPPRGDLRAAFAARGPSSPIRPRSPRCAHRPARVARRSRRSSALLEELPDARTGLSRLERQILEALRDGPLAPEHLVVAVAEHEDPPWLGDDTVFALAADLAPARHRSRYELTPAGAGRPRRHRHPPARSTAGSGESTSAPASPTGPGTPTRAARSASTELGSQGSNRTCQNQSAGVLPITPLPKRLPANRAADTTMPACLNPPS